MELNKGIECFINDTFRAYTVEEVLGTNLLKRVIPDSEVVYMLEIDEPYFKQYLIMKLGLKWIPYIFSTPGHSLPLKLGANVDRKYTPMYETHVIYTVERIVKISKYHGMFSVKVYGTVEDFIDSLLYFRLMTRRYNDII